MQTVDIINESVKLQKNIINEFIVKLKEKCLLSNDVFSFFCKITDLECKVHNIEAEYMEKCDDILENKREYINMFGCNYSDNKDIIFYIDLAYYCKKYFENENVENRLEGIITLLFDTYCKVLYAVKLMDLSKGYLNPETINVARELFLAEICDDEFFDDNYKIFSFNYYAQNYAYNNIFKVLTDQDVLDIAKKYLEGKNNELAFSVIGKLKYNDDFHTKDSLINEMCDLQFSNSPKLLYKFPIFDKQYNLDGTKKNIHELFDEMFEDLKKIVHRLSLESGYEGKNEFPKEYFDCKAFYYELILPWLYLGTEEDYIKIVKKYGVLVIQDLLSDMEKYFNNKAQKKLQYTNIFKGESFEDAEYVKNELKRSINAIVRFRNGVTLNPIAEQLLREGGFIRGTREFLPQEVLKRREVFANSLIGVYDAVESENEYRQRAENEKADIDEVINALYYNRFENFLNNTEVNEQLEVELGKIQVVRTAQILKMAKIISDTTGQNYFREFLCIPDVNRLMIMFEKDENDYLTDCIKKSQIRFKKVVYPETEAENGKYKNYILCNDPIEEDKDIKNKILMLKEEIINKLGK